MNRDQVLTLQLRRFCWGASRRAFAPAVPVDTHVSTQQPKCQTGHSDFSESTDAVKALTPEEKAAKLARMKELIAARRAARGEEEKVDHVKVCSKKTSKKWISCRVMCTTICVLGWPA